MAEETPRKKSKAEIATLIKTVLGNLVALGDENKYFQVDTQKGTKRKMGRIEFDRTAEPHRKSHYIKETPSGDQTIVKSGKEAKPKLTKGGKF